MKLTQKLILVLKKTEKQVKNLKGMLISQSCISSSWKRSSADTKESTCQDALSAASSTTHDEVWTVKQQAIKVEVIATLQFTSQNVPFRAAESLAMCYQQQFPDSVIAKSVAVGSNTMSYVVAYGLRPYFTGMTIRELIEGQTSLTLHFNEAANAQAKKQMDVLVPFWSDTQWSRSEVPDISYVWPCKSRGCCERNAWC